MRSAEEAEIRLFKEGIVRMLSNLMVYKVKSQYLDNKEMFDNHAYSVHDQSTNEAEAEIVEQDDLTDSEEESKEETKEESAAKFPFF